MTATAPTVKNSDIGTIVQKVADAINATGNYTAEVIQPRNPEGRPCAYPRIKVGEEVVAVDFGGGRVKPGLRVDGQTATRKQDLGEAVADVVATILASFNRKQNAKLRKTRNEVLLPQLQVAANEINEKLGGGMFPPVYVHYSGYDEDPYLIYNKSLSPFYKTRLSPVVENAVMQVRLLEQAEAEIAAVKERVYSAVKTLNPAPKENADANS